MHEMSIAQSILDIALEEIAKQGCDRLDLIRVECGALAGVVPDSLQFCFEALVQGGPHAAARLELVTIPLLLRCSTCGQCPAALRRTSATRLESRLSSAPLSMLTSAVPTTRSMMLSTFAL